MKISFCSDKIFTVITTELCLSTQLFLMTDPKCEDRAQQIPLSDGLVQVKLHDIKNDAWVTANNDFLSRVRRFGNDFHKWWSHEWKSLPNRLMSDKKIIIHGSECIILFLTRYFMSWTHKSAKKYHRALISPLFSRGGLFWSNIVMSPQLICDVMKTRKTGIVTSYLSIVIARANWRKGDLLWWITAVNIVISPPGIHGLACKKQF